MLDEVRIRGLGVIEDAVLELGPGLTVLTGETGAGKTMVVQGLTLLLGGRADPGAVRPGSERALVEGRVVLDARRHGDVLARAADAGAETDDDGPGDPDRRVLLLSRTVSAEGRSRAHAGGRGVPVAALGGLAESLVALHGQSDQQRLLRPAEQRAALDRLGGPPLAAALDAHRTAYARWRRLAEEHARLTREARDRAQEAALLRAGLEQVDAAGPTAGEDAALAAEAERLGNADALRTAAVEAQVLLSGDEAGDGGDVLDLVVRARRAVEAAGRHDATLAGHAARLRELGALAADLAADLASYAAGVETDPARLAAVEERRAVLGALVRRYAAAGAERAPAGADPDRHQAEGRPGLDAVLRWAAGARERLAVLDADDDRVTALAAEEQEAAAATARTAAALRAARRDAAARLASEATAELAALAMPHARLSAALTDHEAADDRPVVELDGRRVAVGPHGADDVELLLAPHPGAPARPLHKGASGGELSRVMLALEVVLAGDDPVPTMVFDEVDAGVGGRAAVEIGRRLARLARDHQVLVVTHLPQVAAYADRHLLVAKTEDGSVTRTGVTALSGADRVRELSRMLAGQDGSALAQGHAEELLAEAAAHKAQDVREPVRAGA